MFGNSYSDASLNNFIEVFREFDYNVDDYLKKFPVEGVKNSDEINLDSFSSFFDKQKKLDRINRSLFTSAVIKYLFDYYYDGKSSHRDKFLREALKTTTPIGVNTLLNQLKKDFKNSNNHYFQSGLIWGKKFHDKYISGDKYLDNEILEEYEEYNDNFYHNKDSRIISVIAPKDNNIFDKGKLTIYETYFDIENRKKNFGRCDFSYVNKFNSHLVCNIHDSNFYYDLYSDEEINGVFESFRYEKFLSYDDEITPGKLIYQFETIDSSLSEVIELKVRKSLKFAEELKYEISDSIEQFLEKYADTFNDNYKLVTNSDKYKNLIDHNKPEEDIYKECQNELFFICEISTEQMLEDLIHHLNTKFFLDIKMQKQTTNFKQLNDIKFFYQDYCFLQRRQRVSSSDNQNWRYGWESNIVEDKYSKQSSDISFFEEVFKKLIRYQTEGLLANRESSLNLEEIYSKFNIFKKKSYDKLISLHGCYSYEDKFGINFRTWMRHDTKFNYVFCLIMSNPFGSEFSYNIDSKIIIKMWGNILEDSFKYNLMNLNNLDEDGDEVSSESLDDFEYDVEHSLVNPFQTLNKLKNNNNSYKKIYEDHLSEKVLRHGNFVRHPIDDKVIKFLETDE